MTGVVLLPTVDATSRRNFARTVESGVRFEQIRHLIPAADLDTLLTLYPSGRASVWGVWPGRNEQQVPKWARIRAGDIAAFSGRGGLSRRATVTYTMRNPALARALWGPRVVEGQEYDYELIFLVKDVATISVSYEDMNPRLGWGREASIREIRSYEGEQAELLLELIHPESAAANEPSPAPDSDLLVELEPEPDEQSDDDAETAKPDPALSKTPASTESVFKSNGATVELVASEHNTVEEYETAPRLGTLAVRNEASLVRSFESYLRSLGHEVTRARITIPGVAHTLITDTLDLSDRRLYEAKSTSDRATIRLAVGQLIDYLRFLPDSAGGVLVLAEPPSDLKDLIWAAGFTVTFRSSGAWITE